MSGETQDKLTKILEALKAKQYHHSSHPVLLSQSRQLLECYTDLTEGASHFFIWQTILDDALLDVRCTEYRIARSDLIEYKLDHAHKKLREIATRAKLIALGT